MIPRTVSFPNPIRSYSTSNPIHRPIHARSISLPDCLSHPLINQLRHEITDLQSQEWNEPTRVIDGLSRLKSVLDTFDEILQLPQTSDSLHPKTIERHLEDFLIFVDMFDTFRTSMLGFRQEVSSAQVAIRTNDVFTLGVYVKAHKKIACEIGKLTSNVGSVADDAACYDDEIGRVIWDVHGLMAFVSKGVFNSIPGWFGTGRKPNWAGFGIGKVKDEEGVLGGIEKLLEMRKKRKRSSSNNGETEEVKMSVLKMMEEMEECVGDMEIESERVFRSLITTRVSLLNILTHA